MCLTDPRRQEAIDNQHGWSITYQKGPWPGVQITPFSQSHNLATLSYEPSGGEGWGGTSSWPIVWVADGHSTGLATSLDTLPQIDLERVRSAESLEGEDAHLLPPPPPVVPARTAAEVYAAVDERLASMVPPFKAVDRGSLGDCFFLSLTAGG